MEYFFNLGEIMKINVNLYNSETNDLAIVIDLLRASTTIIVALNTFNKIIPINDMKTAIKLKEKCNATLAGEINAESIDKFDVSNSPHRISNYTNNTLILKTTNGTKVLENIRNRNSEVKILIGAAINARAVAKKAIELANEEIELVMAGRHQKFTIEDCIGAGLIVNEILKLAQKEDIPIDLSESAQVSQMIATDENIAFELITSSHSADKLRSLNFSEDIKICGLINKLDTVPIYKNEYIISLDQNKENK